MRINVKGRVSVSHVALRMSVLVDVQDSVAVYVLYDIEVSVAVEVFRNVQVAVAVEVFAYVEGSAVR